MGDESEQAQNVWNNFPDVKSNTDTVTGVGDIDREYFNLFEIFSQDHPEISEPKDYPEKLSPLSLHPQLENVEEKGGKQNHQQEENQEDESSLPSSSTANDEKSTPTSSVDGQLNHPSRALMISSVSAVVAVLMGMLKFKQGSKLITPAVASMALTTLVMKQVYLLLHSKANDRHFSQGTPKVVECVRTAKDLLIKKISRETGALQAQLKLEDNGARIVNMSQGVPCLPIFDASHKAMVDFLNKKLIPYSEVIGEPHVRKSAALFVNQFYRQTGECELDESNIVITAGAIQAIYNCLALSIEGPNDVVATTVPAYGLYQQQCKLLRGSFATFQDLSAEGLHQLFRTENVGERRIRSLVLCIPNNPMGTMITISEAKSMCKALDEIYDEYYASDPAGGFSVILDEVYLGITARPVQSLLSHASPRLRESLFLILSCSKGLGAMPGARAAWITTPNKAMVTEIGKLQLVCTGNASTISQAGLKGSLDHLRENPFEMQKVWNYYNERTSFVVSRLEKLSTKFSLGNIAESASATFYVWADFGGLPRVPGLSSTDIELAVFLRSLHTKQGANFCGVAAVPGSAFEVSPDLLKLRFSCACDNMKDLEAAMDAVEYGVETICKSFNK